MIPMDVTLVGMMMSFRRVFAKAASALLIKIIWIIIIIILEMIIPMNVILVGIVTDVREVSANA